MIRRLEMPVGLPLLLLCASGALAQDREPALDVSVDSGRHEVVVAAGPFDLPSMAGHHHGDDESMMLKFNATFVWPVQAMVRGFSFELRDVEGKKRSQRVLHHLNLINYSRRQLLLPIKERVLGVGRETRDLMLPQTIGMPIDQGSRMKLYIMWHNETPEDAEGVTITLRIKFSPANLLPVPASVFPLTMDLADGPGRSTAYMVPAGRSATSREFIMPVDGRLLGVSGHMHEWGKAVRLEEAASGKVLVTITPILDSAGRVTRMPIRLFGIAGAGLKLHADRRYRLVAIYDNPTGAPLVGMAALYGIFTPRDLGKWPDKDSKMTAYQDEGAFVAPITPVTPAADGPQHQHN